MQVIRCNNLFQFSSIIIGGMDGPIRCSATQGPPKFSPAQTFFGRCAQKEGNILVHLIVFRDASRVPLERVVADKAEVEILPWVIRFLYLLLCAWAPILI